MTVAEHESCFRSMGCDVRLLIAGPRAAAAAAAARERDFVEAYAATLTRFDDRSELSRLNADPRGEVPASPLLRTAVSAALWAAERTGGVADPTLVAALERAGYGRSLDGATPAPLLEALASAPRRRCARPDRAGRWRSVRVDHRAGTIARPPGVQIDSGGTGKGLAADAVALRLGACSDRYAVDCGGDIAVGGAGAAARPYAIEVRHPFTDELVAHVPVGSGGIATSGIDSRVWQRPDGSFAHHLIDPSSGEPAWSGVVRVTAVAASALEAETLAKQALLLGPAGARSVLAPHGGLVVHDNGDVEAIGSLARRATVAA